MRGKQFDVQMMRIFKLSHVLHTKQSVWKFKNSHHLNIDKASHYHHRDDIDEVDEWPSIPEVEWGLNWLKIYQCTKFLLMLKDPTDCQ